MLVLALFIFLLFFCIAYRRPLLALVGLVALLPAYNLRFTIFNLPSTILEFIIWGVFLGWSFSLLCPAPSVIPAKAGIQLLKSRLKIIKYPLGLFFLASIISVFVAPDLYRAVGLWRAFFLEPAMVFLMILAVVKDRRDFEKIIFGLSLSALFISIIAIGQRFFHLPILPPWDKELRVMSVFTQPNMVGLYLGPIIILMLGQIIKDYKNKPLATCYLLLATVLSLIAIILAQSDGAIVGILGAVAVFLLLWNNKTRIFIIALTILLTTCYLLLNNNLSFINDKLLFRDWSGFVRLQIWRETWTMLKDHWLFGAGVGGYPLTIVPYHTSRDWMEIYPMPHTIIFNFWSEIGLLGLGAFLWLLEKFARMCYALLRKDRLIAITAIAGMTVIIIHGLVDVPILKNDLSIIFWIIFSVPYILDSNF